MNKYLISLIFLCSLLLISCEQRRFGSTRIDLTIHPTIDYFYFEYEYKQKELTDIYVDETIKSIVVSYLEQNLSIVEMDEICVDILEELHNGIKIHSKRLVKKNILDSNNSNALTAGEYMTLRLLGF